MTPGHAVVAHLRARGVPLGETSARIIAALVDDAPRYASATTLMRGEGIPDTTARWRMRKASLPAPGRFFRLGRGIALAAALERMRGASVAEVSRLCGFRDHAGAAKLCRRQFGRTASEVRLYARRGPEWLVDAWLERRP